MAVVLAMLGVGADRPSSVRVSSTLCNQLGLQLGAVLLEHFDISTPVVFRLQQIKRLQNVVRQRVTFRLLQLWSGPCLSIE